MRAFWIACVALFVLSAPALAQKEQGGTTGNGKLQNLSPHNTGKGGGNTGGQGTGSINKDDKTKKPPPKGQDGKP
jgi:hypothetical protein